MLKTWSWYSEQLREIDDNLYNLKEQFKMGLLKPVKKVSENEAIEVAKDEKSVISVD